MNESDYLHTVLLYSYSIQRSNKIIFFFINAINRFLRNCYVFEI